MCAQSSGSRHCQLESLDKTHDDQVSSQPQADTLQSPTSTTSNVIDVQRHRLQAMQGADLEVWLLFSASHRGWHNKDADITISYPLHVARVHYRAFLPLSNSDHYQWGNTNVNYINRKHMRHEEWRVQNVPQHSISKRSLPERLGSNIQHVKKVTNHVFFTNLNQLECKNIIPRAWPSPHFQPVY